MPAVTVPIALLGACAGLIVAGFAIDTLTLFALILAIGLGVDDAIVALETIERGEEPPLAAALGARPVTLAVIATLATLIAVFLPSSFLEGEREASSQDILSEIRPELARITPASTRAFAPGGLGVGGDGGPLEVIVNAPSFEEAAEFIGRDREYPVILQVRDADRDAPDDLTVVTPQTAGGALVPLDGPIELERRAPARAYDRFDRQPSVEVSTGLAQCVDLGAAIEVVGRAADELPEGARIAYDGEARDDLATTGGVAATFGIALVVVFLVLTVQSEGFAHPVTIMLPVPHAVTGALFTLPLAGQSLDIYTRVGPVLLIGLTAENGIPIVEFADELRDEGREVRGAVEEAAAAAARLRLAWRSGSGVPRGSPPGWVGRQWGGSGPLWNPPRRSCLGEHCVERDGDPRWVETQLWPAPDGGSEVDAGCSIPEFRGARLSPEHKEALWDRLFTGAPRPRTPCERRCEPIAGFDRAAGPDLRAQPQDGREAEEAHGRGGPPNGTKRAALLIARGRAPPRPHGARPATPSRGPTGEGRPCPNPHHRVRSRRARHRAPAERGGPPSDRRAGRAQGPDDRGGHPPAAPPRRPRPAPSPSSRRPRRLRPRPQARDARRAHGPRARARAPGVGATTFPPRSRPRKAGTGHLASQGMCLFLSLSSRFPSVCSECPHFFDGAMMHCRCIANSVDWRMTRERAFPGRHSS